MPGIKELKTRIKSIGSTRKITRAMQMVSAAKMRKAQDATLKSRTYADLAWGLIGNLSSVIPAQAGILNQDQDSGSEAGMTNTLAQLMSVYPKATKIGVVIISTNKGLVGSLNTNLLAQVRNIESAELLTEIVTYGKKAHTMSARMSKNLAADFPKLDKTASVEDIYPIAEFITKAYATGKYQKIVILYNHFVSTLIQKPTVKQLLPFIETNDTNGTQGSLPIHRPSEKPINGQTTGYLFEPNPQEVLKHLLPRIIESQLYQAVLESNASEESARMVMMKNATEAAEDLISDLTLAFNKLRQNKITTELAEITAGKIALE